MICCTKTTKKKKQLCLWKPYLQSSQVQFGSNCAGHEEPLAARVEINVQRSLSEARTACPLLYRMFLKIRGSAFFFFKATEHSPFFFSFFLDGLKAVKNLTGYKGLTLVNNHLIPSPRRPWRETWLIVQLLKEPFLMEAT